MTLILNLNIVNSIHGFINLLLPLYNLFYTNTNRREIETFILITHSFLHITYTLNDYKKIEIIVNLKKKNI